MKAVVDRIEDGRTAVIVIEGGGQIFIPLEKFDFKVYEGAHLNVNFKLDSESEKKMRHKTGELQQELLKRTGKKDEEK